MKLLLDMQGAQSESRHRGIGRYTRSLSLAFAKLAADQHELRFAFNRQLDEATDSLIAGLGEFANRNRRIVYPSLAGIAEREVGNERKRQAARRLARHAFEQQRVDIIWYSSLFEGYVDDVVVPDRVPRHATSIATLYDLIPLHEPAAYLSHPRVRRWYEDRLEIVKQCDLLLSISQWVRKDAIVRLGVPEESIIAIGAGVDELFTKPADGSSRELAIKTRYRIEKPYVLYNGGFDARKNVERLVTAFGELPEDIKRTHQLVIVGRPTEQEKILLQQVAKRARLDSEKLKFTGFVSDDDLVSLYAGCALFVFPSSYEGFGLTPLEAMACGSPVIGSNTASLPEVIGDSRALFDPSRTSAIVERMSEVLRQPTLADELRSHAARQSKLFSWQAVAARALSGIESHFAHKHAKRHNRPIDTPTPPRLTCVAIGATFPGWLTELASHYVVVTHQLNATKHDPGWPSDDELCRADRILYFVESGQEHLLADTLHLWPGVVWIEPASSPAAEFTCISLPERYRLYGYQGLFESSDNRRDQLLLLAQFSLGLVLPSADAVLFDESRDIRIASAPDNDVAMFCIEQLEHGYTEQSLGQELHLIDELSEIIGPDFDDDALAQVSDAAMTSRRVPAACQWLVDVSQIVSIDLGTGVQRVVRSILREWLLRAPATARIEPVAFIDGHYRYARSYALSLLDLPTNILADDYVEVRPGDIFVGLDWTADSLAAAEPQLRQWRRLGVSMHFVVHDLLPVTLPDAFHTHSQKVFVDWLRRICIIADSLHCVSQATADELRGWMDATLPPFQFGRVPAVSNFFLGVDSGAVDALVGTLPHELSVALASRPSLLMVGTLEPRKGHAQVLEAVEQLWHEGHDLSLVVIGHRGWLVESLISKLERHPERNRRLFWLNDADDSTLEALYRQSTALLAASWGEGYGLPLIEAAHRGLPVIARDLPVFREVMVDYPSYFTADSPNVLADFLRQWLLVRPAASAPNEWPTWLDSATGLAGSIQMQAAAAL